MDIGAVILDPLERIAIPHLLGAIRATIDDPGSKGLGALVDHVAFSVHAALGPRVVVHFRDRLRPAHDPYSLFADMPGDFGGAGLGPGISGYLGDASHGKTPHAWTCLHERRTGAWEIHRGFMYTFEGTDSSEGPGAFTRLVERLRVSDAALLRSKLERPDSEWCSLDRPLPPAVAAALDAVAA